MRLLDFYVNERILLPSEKTKAFESGFIPDVAKPMHELDLNLIAEIMDRFDKF